jgi:hypothetical protein
VLPKDMGPEPRKLFEQLKELGSSGI